MSNDRQISLSGGRKRQDHLLKTDKKTTESKL